MATLESKFVFESVVMNEKNIFLLKYKFFFTAILIFFLFSAYQKSNVVYQITEGHPVLSIYTILLYMILMIERVIRKLLNNLFILLFFSLNLILIIFFLYCHFTEKLFILNYTIPSLSTLTVLITFNFYEFANKWLSKRTSVIFDILLFISIPTYYLSFIGHLSGLLFLTGNIQKSEIGISFSTMILSMLYLILCLSSDKNTITFELLTKIKWAKHIIIIFLVNLLLMPILSSILVKRLYFNDDNLKLILEMYYLFGYILIALYLSIAKILYNTHSKLVTICSYTKKIRNNEQNWISLEEYFSENFGVKFTHGISPEIMVELEDELKKEK